MLETIPYMELLSIGRCTDEDWCDPNSSADGLHAVHAALHGGRMDFSEKRIEVLVKLLELQLEISCVCKALRYPKTILVVSLVCIRFCMINEAWIFGIPPATPNDLESRLPHGFR